MLLAMGSHQAGRERKFWSSFGKSRLSSDLEGITVVVLSPKMARRSHRLSITEMQNVTPRLARQWRGGTLWRSRPSSRLVVKSFDFWIGAYPWPCREVMASGTRWGLCQRISIAFVRGKNEVDQGYMGGNREVSRPLSGRFIRGYIHSQRLQFKEVGSRLV